MAQRGGGSRQREKAGEVKEGEGAKRARRRGERKEGEHPHKEEGLLLMSLGAWGRIQSSKEPRFS